MSRKRKTGSDSPSTTDYSDDGDIVWRVNDDTIYFYAEVTTETAARLIGLLQTAVPRRKPMRIDLFSDGGDAHAGLALFDTLRAIPYDLEVRVVGCCASAATLILMAAKTRIMTKNSYLLIHEVSTSFEGTRANLQIELDNTNTINNSYQSIYEANSADINIRKEMQTDKLMTAIEALRNGLVDVVEPIWVRRVRQRRRV
jgi:ATP-dependent Clp protease protease subunit